MESTPQNNNSKVILAWVLIGVGILWILRKIIFYFDFPDFYFQSIFFPFKNVVHNFSHALFSWPMVLIIVGLILTAGKRSAGIVLMVIGGIFILPKFLILPGITFSLFLPLLLVGVGVALIVKKL